MFVLCIKCVFLACSIELALDDLKALIQISKFLKKNYNCSVVRKRNEVVEILLETQGHRDGDMANKRSMRLGGLAFIIVLIEWITDIEYISLFITLITIFSGVCLKRKCNKEYTNLKRKTNKVLEKKEKWDLYTEKRKFTGEEHIRGAELPDDRFHLVVHVWVKNKKGEYLISQRAANRQTNPLMWECIGGSVLKGEESIDGAIREAKEEVGIELLKDRGKVKFSKTRKYVNGEKFNDIMDVWLFEYDGEVELKKATTDEVAQVLWMNLEDIKKLWENEKMVSTLEYFFTEIEKDNDKNIL